ncbi:NAD(P)-binding Rossmann-fold superfamily protein [Rhynchospora pubera]|uniref:NAD(P)-binding Rossmann-fold superfamily protein n=1 Tax=Rhynchospora pubera TaxID=906938 RepID=A0AAV8CIX8_9POAL|nr:NAD(P)-binding Rossmann-fold superfamily protein [Rhynchospora pubera]
MELMVLRSRPAAISLARPKLHRLPSTQYTDSVSFPSKSASSPVNSNLRSIQSPPMPSSSVKVSATGSVASTSGISKQEGTSKDKDVVFVAGSTGRVGSRLVRELLKLGFRVRAGVRSSQRAGSLVQSVKQLKPVDSTQAPPEERLEIVECDLENQNTIQSAIANASIVICCIGASEKEVFDITGPYRIDYKATANLIQEATKLQVDHFILLTSLGTGQIGFPASLLNLFWGVLCWKRRAEEELISSGLPYTIVRPGGMERPTDSFKETHNLVLAKEDTYFGGLVSNLQVAELMACMARNRKLSCCKVVEVIAETTAPLLPMEQLLTTIPSQRPLPPDPEPEPEPEPRPEPKSESEPDKVQVSKPRPLSPYAAYEDLKPPSSPAPSQPKIEPKSTTASVVDAKEPTQVSDGGSRPLSPYPSYDDLKPPSSPSPSAPNNGTVISISTSTSENLSPSAAVIEPDNVPEKPYPLSPYTMYEDLKPPSSPLPSVPK